MDKIFTEHIKDLSSACEKRGSYVFTPFLNLDEQSTVISLKKELCDFEMFGGISESERKIVRFEPPYETDDNGDYPISCIEIRAKNARFADEFSHRDILGALMSLGIVRSQTGDIIISENKAYVFVISSKADFISTELTKVKHTDVLCGIVHSAPAEALVKTEDVRIIAASLRLDCIVGGVYNLSRSVTQKLIDAGKVFVNAKEQLKPSVELSPGNVVSVRGFGKFIFSEVNGNTRKGRLSVTVKKYI